MSGDEGYIASHDGTRLYYQRLGNGADTVVSPAACFLNPDLESLATGRTIIFYDTRNRGRSQHITDGDAMTMTQEVRDLEAVRQHFALTQFKLLGWSYLGAVTALYAANNPMAIERLLLVGPMKPRRFRYPDEDESKIRLRVDPQKVQRLEELRQAGVETQDPAAYCRAWQQTYLPRQMGNSDAIGRMRSDPCALPNEWGSNVTWTFQQLGRSWGDWDWRPILAPLQVPTLIIHGSEDTIPLASSWEWAATLGNARLLVLPNVGHFPWVEEPSAFFPPVEQFLAGQWPDAASAVIAKELQ
jgi:proline iminopeptidase